MFQIDVFPVLLYVWWYIRVILLLLFLKKVIYGYLFL